MLSVLSDKVRRGNLIVLDNLDISDARTKSVKTVLNSLGMEKTTLIVTNGPNENVIRSSRNLDKVKTLPVKVINTLDLMNSFNVLITEDAVRQIEEIWGGVYKGEPYFAPESSVVQGIESALEASEDDLSDQNEEIVSGTLGDDQLLDLIVSQIEPSKSQGDS
tara:strand:- start:619 stop:1107 length:489 start_codon:yes stop_codon:yes gene_type:complete